MSIWSYGVTVSTLDSESSDRGSNPRRTLCHDLMTAFWQTMLCHEMQDIYGIARQVALHMFIRTVGNVLMRTSSFCLPWLKDTLAERLRRRPAKPMGSPRVGSNPTGVVLLMCRSLPCGTRLHAQMVGVRSYRENLLLRSYLLISKAMTLAGLEPAIFGSEDQRLIH
jgi:hypothetical protein